MICYSCKIDRNEDDFINNNKYCFRCAYRKKMENITEKQDVKVLICRTCENEIIRKENEKKRQRTVFCSKECAQKGHEKQLKNHWTRRIRDKDTWLPEEID